MKAEEMITSRYAKKYFLGTQRYAIAYLRTCSRRACTVQPTNQRTYPVPCHRILLDLVCRFLTYYTIYLHTMDTSSLPFLLENCIFFVQRSTFKFSRHLSRKWIDHVTDGRKTFCKKLLFSASDEETSKWWWKSSYQVIEKLKGNKTRATRWVEMRLLLLKQWVLYYRPLH